MQGSSLATLGSRYIVFRYYDLICVEWGTGHSSIHDVKCGSQLLSVLFILPISAAIMIKCSSCWCIDCWEKEWQLYLLKYGWFSIIITTKKAVKFLVVWSSTSLSVFSRLHFTFKISQRIQCVSVCSCTCMCVCLCACTCVCPVRPIRDP